jgi:anti-sigma factor RsiW
MSSETLNQLLADRAVGELPPDVRELLDAYLAREPAAAKRLAELNATVALARRALARASSPAASVRPFPRDRVRAARHRRAALVWIRPLAMAACVALAFIVGMKFSRPAAVAPAAELVAADSGMPGFWAAASVRSALDQPPREARTVRWSSPLRWPRIES